MGAFALPTLQELLSNYEGEQAFFSYMLSPTRKDLIALVQIGSGKTVTFMLPILQKLLSNRQAEQSFFACVLLPMRELVIQIVEQFEALRSTIGLRYSMENIGEIGGAIGIENGNTGEARKWCGVVTSGYGRIAGHHRLRETHLLGRFIPGACFRQVKYPSFLIFTSLHFHYNIAQFSMLKSFYILLRIFFEHVTYLHY
ncbi:hypothetical protein ZEAMMB73_Zm00001d049935 [Zea mays]|uniref:DEAD/DEAH-box helicase domain-containing protein n=1 Tax=Zea mays TaxID=4577 RepID=A0A1D6PYU0_MAIZE|nr:hypothetical protein ZEAMMB73_Zm00001d049935 [Zea mays]